MVKLYLPIFFAQNRVKTLSKTIISFLKINYLENPDKMLVLIFKKNGFFFIWV